VFSFLVALLLAPAAQASQSISVSGSFYPTTPGPIDYEEFLFWDDWIILQTWEFELTGTFSGIAVVHQMIVIELDTGKVEGLDGVMFTGTVDGESGSWFGLNEWTVVGGFAVGNWKIFIGTGGLANLEGEGTFVTDFETGVGALSGYIEFDD
jgi:hypothetical protein